MSEHDIADCPKCGKRDYVLKEDNIWICLNCNHTDKMPKSKFDPESESKPDLSIVIMVTIAVVLLFLVLGGRDDRSDRRRGTIHSPLSFAMIRRPELFHSPESLFVRDL